MCKDYIVVFQNAKTGRCGIDTFTENSVGKVRKAFHECYRHEVYNILAVIEKPEVDKT